MKNLALIKSANFGNVQCDFWENENGDVFMTAEQLGMVLEYATPRESVNKIISRNNYLRQPEFSCEVKMTSPRGDTQNTRVFTEDGIYEVTMLSRQPKAREFRSWVRKVLKSLRKGETILVQPLTQDAKLLVQQQRAEAMLLNARTRQAKLILEMQKTGCLSPVAVELLGVNALEMLTNQPVNYRPEIEKTYTATEIADELGVSATMVGRVANANGLKTPEFGIHVLDKSPHSNKQVTSFRYNEQGRRKLGELIDEKQCGRKDG